MNKSERTTRSRILTIMMIDIVDYTRISSVLGREKFDELNENFDRMALPLFEQYAGRVIKKAGDSFLVVFESATDSLHCAIALQNRFWEYNESKAGPPIKVKIALNSGEVIVRDNDIYGEPVNVVSRVEKITKPGQIYFTHPVFLAMNKNEIPYIYLGRRMVKGIGHPLKIFRVEGLYEERKNKIRYVGSLVATLVRGLLWVVVLAGLGWLVYRIISDPSIITNYWDKLSEFVRNLA